jgi:hypothetical protein
MLLIWCRFAHTLDCRVLQPQFTSACGCTCYSLGPLYASMVRHAAIVCCSPCVL